MSDYGDTMTSEDIKSQIKAFVLKEFLPGEAEENLTDDIGLISEGIIDSMGMLRLVSFLEEKFNVSIPAHEVDAEHLDRFDLILETVAQNQKEG